MKLSNNLFGLREYQMDAVTQIEQAWLNGVRSVCCQGATGSGKTKVLRAIIANHAFSKKLIYIIAHRRNLVHQLSDESINGNIRHGIIASGFPIINYRVQVCSLQTLIRRLDKLPEAELIIIDEAHHVKSNSYLKIIEKWKSSLILGVTATPRRLDGKPLSDIFQKLIIGPDMRKLIDEGYLSDYNYYAPDVVSMEGVHKQAGEYKTSEVLERIDNKYIIGSAVDHYRKYADHQPAICSCASIAHAEHMATEFKAAGYKALAVHSKLDQKIISDGIQGLKDGSLEILTQCELLGEGIDIPGATALIGLRPTMSETIFLQHIGRVLRKNGNKNKAIILDHVGNWERHGLPDDERFWSLDGKSDKGTLEYKRCPDCIRPVKKQAKQCPYCGYIWHTEQQNPKIPETKEGELIEITKKVKISISWEGLQTVIRNEAKSLRHAIALARYYGKTHRHAYWIWKNILRR